MARSADSSARSRSLRKRPARSLDQRAVRIGAAREPEQLVADHPPAGGLGDEPSVGERSERAADRRPRLPGRARERRRRGGFGRLGHRDEDVDRPVERNGAGDSSTDCSSHEQSRQSDDQVISSTDADRLRHPHRVRDDRRPDSVPRRADRRARAAVGHERARDADVPVEPPVRAGSAATSTSAGRGTMRTSSTCRSTRCAARHLDPYGVDVGIVEPDEAAVFSVLPNAQLAARLCSAYNDWLLENWLQPEPRLRGMIVVPAQWPEAAAREIRRVGGRDEFVGVFLPGASRIPYGNPVHDPIWEAVERARPPGRRAHALRVDRDRRPAHGGGDAGLLRRVPHPLRLRDVRALRLDPLPRDLRALPRDARRDGRGRARSVRRLPLAPRHELEVVPVRDPLVPPTSVRVRLGSRPLRHAAARGSRRAGSAAAGDRVPPACGDAHVRERLPALGLRRARADAPSASRRVARQRPLAQRRRILPAARAGIHPPRERAPRARCAFPSARPRRGRRSDRRDRRPPHRPLPRRGRPSSRSPTAAPIAAHRSAQDPSRRRSKCATGRSSSARGTPPSGAPGTSGSSTSRRAAHSSDERLRVRRYDVQVHGDEIIVSLDAPPDRTV